MKNELLLEGFNYPFPHPQVTGPGSLLILQWAPLSALPSLLNPPSLFHTMWEAGTCLWAEFPARGSVWHLGPCSYTAELSGEQRRLAPSTCEAEP